MFFLQNKPNNTKCFIFRQRKNGILKGKIVKKRREVYAKNIIRVSFFGDY